MSIFNWSRKKSKEPLPKLPIPNVPQTVIEEYGELEGIAVIYKFREGTVLGREITLEYNHIIDDLVIKDTAIQQEIIPLKRIEEGISPQISLENKQVDWQKIIEEINSDKENRIKPKITPLPIQKIDFLDKNFDHDKFSI